MGADLQLTELQYELADRMFYNPHTSGWNGYVAVFTAGLDVMRAVTAAVDTGDHIV